MMSLIRQFIGAVHPLKWSKIYKCVIKRKLDIYLK